MRYFTLSELGNRFCGNIRDAEAAVIQAMDLRSTEIGETLCQPIAVRATLGAKYVSTKKRHVNDLAIVYFTSWHEYSSPVVPAMSVVIAPRRSPLRDMTVSCSTTSYLVIASSSAGDH